MSAESHPLYLRAQSAAAADPGFHLTSLLELVAQIGKSFVDTPEERAQIKAAVLLAYDHFVAPRPPLIAEALRGVVGSLVDGILNSLAGV